MTKGTSEMNACAETPWRQAHFAPPSNESFNQIKDDFTGRQLIIRWVKNVNGAQTSVPLRSRDNKDKQE